jgi:calcium-dependent protein kinase
VIIDFELAINCEMQNYETIRCGTPGYIAPEILRNTTNAPIDPVCDIFSAGVIFYNLLTG